MLLGGCMRTELVLHFVITIACWGLWPVIKRYGNSASAFSMLIVSASALIPLISSSTFTSKINFSFQQIFFFVAAGIAMGTGAKYFNQILAHKDVLIGVSIAIVNGSTTIVTVLGGVIIFGEVLTTKQIAGIASIIIGIILAST